MLGIHDFLTFLVAGIALNLIPGADTIYIIGRSVSQGKKAGIVSALGINTGSFFHTLAASFGLSAILSSSSLAFLAVKYIGASYLVFLGIQMFRAAPLSTRSNNIKQENRALWAIYRQGIITNLSNPKVALFFLAFLPQFISPENQYGILPFLTLGSVFIFTSTCWCFFIVYSTTVLTRKIQKVAVSRNLLKKITGTVFISLGIKLAYEKLP
jgi:threonine/homoserine/homoserine lactone efflux protein